MEAPSTGEGEDGTRDFPAGLLDGTLGACKIGGVEHDQRLGGAFDFIGA